MKPENLKSIVKEIVRECLTSHVKEEVSAGMGTSDISGLGQSTDTSIKRQTDMAKLAQRMEDIDTKSRRLNLFSKERAVLEDERMKIWWSLRKLLQSK